MIEEIIVTISGYVEIIKVKKEKTLILSKINFLHNGDYKIIY
jgi:hypothetical protein